jgi:hypothetical protein
MSEWPQYKSHKIIRAAVIKSLHDDGLGMDAAKFFWVDPGTGKLEPFIPTEIGMMDRVTVGDYAMIYPDGFRSVCPKQQFDEGYQLQETDP